MGLGETLVFYLLVGMVVAGAMYLVEDRRGTAGGGFLLATAVLFWPLYLPMLLSARTSPRPAVENERTVKTDDMTAAIAQVETELDAALRSLDGWAEHALAAEDGRLVELRHALAAQAARIREMDQLLARNQQAADDDWPSGDAPDESARDAVDRWHKCRHARAENVTRLAQVRQQAHADLMATLAWIRELVSMIHLAKFTGAPASRAEELVAQIAAAVEGVSAVAWRETELVNR